MKNLTEKIATWIAESKEKYENLTIGQAAEQVTREEFTLLLGGISACRKVPGIPMHMGYEQLYFCEDRDAAAQVRQHLDKMYGIKDQDSLMKACYGMFSGSREYEQFMTFWKGAPLFDIKDLNPDGRKGFEHCKNLAEWFYPFVEEKGFYAWDINERIGLCRSAAACGMISEEEFWQITDEWVRLAQVFYHSYMEYAVSCLCGGLYHMGKYDSEIQGFFDINRSILDNLLEEGGPWQQNAWYVPEEREWVKLIESNQACLVTKKALDGNYIGYMYRDAPCDPLDSGWRFFVGDESDEYVGDNNNTKVCTLDMICNISPDVMPYLYAAKGRRFGRQESGWEEE